MMKNRTINNLGLEKFLLNYLNNLNEDNKIKNNLCNEILSRIKNDGDRWKWITAKNENKNWTDSNRNIYVDIMQKLNEYDKELVNLLELSATNLDQLSKNEIYSRKEISIFANNYNEQRGILIEKPLTNDTDNVFRPNVFAILNLNNNESKYKDYFVEDLIYYYPLDSGIKYPMNDAANITIKNIVGNDGTGIYVFSKTSKNGYKFLGKFYMHNLENDDNDNLVFVLKPFIKIRNEKEIKTSLVSVWEKEDEWIKKNKIIDKEDAYILTKNRANQGFYRDSLIKKFDSCCILTGIRNKELLIASHIKPYSECSKHEKIDKHNGLLLSALADKLFDKGLISFDSNGEITFSSKISEKDLKSIKKHLVNTNIKEIYSASEKYFKFHYQYIFR